MQLKYKQIWPALLERLREEFPCMMWPDMDPVKILPDFSPEALTKVIYMPCRRIVRLEPKATLGLNASSSMALLQPSVDYDKCGFPEPWIQRELNFDIADMVGTSGDIREDLAKIAFKVVAFTRLLH